jgi:2-oxo-4-hydroxy-4-carboxy--5-ureidoimidazoline (OHCU) decarboxylase
MKHFFSILILILLITPILAAADDEAQITVRAKHPDEAEYKAQTVDITAASEPEAAGEAAAEAGTDSNTKLLIGLGAVAAAGIGYALAKKYKLI